MFDRGQRIFIPGAAGEPSAARHTVFGAGGVEIVTSFVPGINPLTMEEIGPGSHVYGLFMQPSMTQAQRQGIYRHLPISYAAMVKHIAHGPAFDWCVVQVSPPDRDGRFCLGPSAEFTPAAIARARHVMAVVNPNVPALPHAPWIGRDRIDRLVESDMALVTYDVGTVDDATRRIARHVAELVDDGLTLQVGLGKVPHALIEALHDRRRLTVHSGMISDGFIGLVNAGALADDQPHRTTAILGSPALYQWVMGRSDIHVLGVGDIHAPAVLAKIDRLIAVNSALEVDLLGQCNLEWAKGRAVSGGGGSTDFARGARLGEGGISVVALPSTFAGGKGSRIMAQLDGNGIVTLPRTDVDVIVTEEGIADLRGLCVHGRAERIIAVAAPDYRPALAQQWKDIAARL